MRRITALASACLLIPSYAWAATWCSGNFPNAIFCDDFDRYCTDVPAPPDACVTDTNWTNADVNALRTVWVPGPCGTSFNLNSPDKTRINSEPFGTRYNCQPASALGQQTVELVPQIQAAFGNEFTAVMGTDAAPLVLRFTFSGGVASNFHAANDNGYLELALDVDRAPTDYVLHETCSTFCPGPEFGPSLAYPMICPQNAPHPSCPPVATLPQHASIAVGLTAILDNDPCHCGTTGQKPSNSHLNVFDGRRWWKLDAGVFPGSGSFSVGDKFNTVVLTLRTSDMDVELLDKQGGPLGFATVPREYTGGFNKIRGGTAQGCQLVANSLTHECDPNINGGNPGCIVVNGGGANVVFDSVALTGGLGASPDGACCLPNATCQETTEAECDALPGTFGGLGTSCATALCCASPFAARTPMATSTWMTTAISRRATAARRRV